MTDDDLGDIFGGNSPIKILEAFLNRENITIKSQVNLKQIRSMCSIKWQSIKTEESKKPEKERRSAITMFQQDLVPYYLELRCSEKRQSRTEILDTLKNISEKYLQDQQSINSLMMKK